MGLAQMRAWQGAQHLQAPEAGHVFQAVVDAQPPHRQFQTQADAEDVGPDFRKDQQVFRFVFKIGGARNAVMGIFRRHGVDDLWSDNAPFVRNQVAQGVDVEDAGVMPEVEKRPAELMDRLRPPGSDMGWTDQGDRSISRGRHEMADSAKAKPAVW